MISRVEGSGVKVSRGQVERLGERKLLATHRRLMEHDRNPGSQVDFGPARTGSAATTIHAGPISYHRRWKRCRGWWLMYTRQ
jgi:hypothetical protein